MDHKEIWQAKVLAYIHDPAEKALILLRGKGHEQGTVAELKKLLGQRWADARSRVQGLGELVRTADRWAAAADRPSLPKGRGGQVVFARDPQLIHPLTGDKFRLSSLADDIPAATIESVSFDHLQELLVDSESGIDWKQTFLRLWRFAPESPAPNLGVFWNQLPADTRSPDHTIWEHLALTSAFAGAMAADRQGGPALLLMSFGPVQGFIAQARSVSDLWAGSHLLSRIAWEAMVEVCDRYGPDAVLFPNLHGVALTDLWLYGKLGGWPQREKPAWMTDETDANPLFAAALPNRFVALVPEADAQDLAAEIGRKVGNWVRDQAAEALDELLKIAAAGDGAPAKAQIERQLQDFPEVHWAIVPWRLAGKDKLDDRPLQDALEKAGGNSDYLGDPLNQLVRREILLDGVEFFKPNPGVGYPGLFEALERFHAAAKSPRLFSATLEEGYRCTLCGEREWLTLSRSDLAVPAGSRGETLWTAVSRRKPAVAKDGECLCALCTLKRTWPRRFVSEITKAVSDLKSLDRFVLSTHAMAISTSLSNWVAAQEQRQLLTPESSAKASRAQKRLGEDLNRSPDVRPVALPKRLYGQMRRIDLDPERIRFLKQLPALADMAKGEDARERILADIGDLLNGKPETYYALVLMDGDRLGAWLAGEAGRLEMARRFHDESLADLARTGELAGYLAAARPASPARHQAISTALNSFALHLARVVVEDLFMGKLIYAGGDDLMAMVAVHDLPELMFALRCTYSGILPEGQSMQEFWSRLGVRDPCLKLGSGFALLRQGNQRRLLRLMGARASASLGAVIAHHQAPLARVLADLRQAEQKAKNEGGRDAFCLTLGKRAGGTTHLLGKWSLDLGWQGSDMGLLLDLRNLLAGDVSRRAAYLLVEILRDLPPEEDALASCIRFQFKRQARSEQLDPDRISKGLAKAAVNRCANSVRDDGWAAANHWLRNMLLTAEFLAREGRVQQVSGNDRGETS